MNSAYARMLRAFRAEENLSSLVGRIFTSGLNPETECEMGIHSWANEVGQLPPDKPCEHCGELYGQPA